MANNWEFFYEVPEFRNRYRVLFQAMGEAEHFISAVKKTIKVFFSTVNTQGGSLNYFRNSTQRQLRQLKGKMPLYDCMLLLKPSVSKEAIMDLVARVGKHVYRRNGVLTDLKSFGTVQLGYGIKKLDGRYYQGQLMQMTLMTPPSFNTELYYLNKEDRLLRWLLVKHRDMKFGMDYLGEDDSTSELRRFRSNLYDDEKIEEDDDDDDEHEVDEQSESKEG